MTTTTKRNADEFALDPRSLQGPKDSPFLPLSYPEERRTLTAHVIRDLRDHPQTERHYRTGAPLVNEDPTWHRIRALPVREDGLTVDQLLRRDSGTPGFELRWLMTALLCAREKRVELLALVAQLEAVEIAFGGQASDVIRTRATSDHRAIEGLGAVAGR